MKRHIRLKEWGINKDITKTPSLEYAEPRSMEVKPYRIRTDENGFILSGNENIEYNELEIFIGDSFVESVFVEEEKRFTAVLERIYAEKGERVKCLNAGYSGATSLNLLNVIINKIIPLKPRRVWFFLPTNDTRCFSLENGAWSNDKHLSPVIPQGLVSSCYDFNKKDIRRILSLIHHALSTFDIDFVFVTTPHRYGSFDNDYLKFKFRNENNFKRVSNLRLAINEVIRTYSSKKGLKFLDLEKTLAPFEQYSYDDLHLNEYGALKVAKLIEEFEGKL